MKATLPDALTVLPKPLIEVTGNQAICIGGTTNLSPSIGGTWTSMNPLIAVVNNSGLVTGNFSRTGNFQVHHLLPPDVLQMLQHL
ncbi:MAG: hypothetical protein IPG18_02340 [Saprospiraceae bacterium]|nr:hypothetical protein [Saprospiraceae bacterium]